MRVRAGSSVVQALHVNSVVLAPEQSVPAPLCRLVSLSRAVRAGVLGVGFMFGAGPVLIWKSFPKPLCVLPTTKLWLYHFGFFWYLIPSFPCGFL